MSQFSGAAAGWFQFFTDTVLPVASRELLQWLYDWQILISGILALIAARIWGRSVIRAAQISGRSRRGDWKRRGLDSVAPNECSSRETLQQQLHALREVIRITLGNMPCTDEILSSERIGECRKIAEFQIGELNPQSEKLFVQRHEALRRKLGALKTVRESDTCRNAWEALVRISMDARDLMSEEVSAGSR